MGSVINYIHNHYAEDLKLEKLAQIFYISPYYLCREFKRQTNRTITQYINITRIMNAQRMFMETDENVTEISKATGFSNIIHFNRVFKNVTGMMGN
ncbi:AraC family transcriptional regulator [Lacrimispora sp. BS-2]|uniref:AraC family transcriptional regulator n=1 Tax=Lacrimispora sp. BS-2 TaxID=3151850 RepID=A0AAU7PQU3_9FIRM